MTLIEKLTSWWNAPSVDLKNVVDDVEALRRRWGFNVNPQSVHARPPVPPGRIFRECGGLLAPKPGDTTNEFDPQPHIDARLQNIRDVVDQGVHNGIHKFLIDLGWAPPHQQGFKLNAERSVAVATDYFWNDDMATCPSGVKVQLLGRGGVAVYGTYSGSDFWTAWAPCPKRR